MDVSEKRRPTTLPPHTSSGKTGAQVRTTGQSDITFQNDSCSKYRLHHSITRRAAATLFLHWNLAWKTFRDASKAHLKIWQ